MVLALVVVFGCDRDSPGVSGDSLGDSTTPINPAIDTTATLATGWEPDAGPYVILPTVDGGLLAGSLLRPGISGDRLGDTVGLGAVVAPGRIELFSRAGKVGVARLSVEQSRRIEPECAAWPTARLLFATGAETPPWTAAFAEGRITAIPLDSIEGMTPRDSAKLAADLTRLASALPDDTSATFRGLPFVVLRAYRAKGDDAFIVATLIRRINQEDAPKEERLVMVVESSNNDASRWRVAWFERAAGTEEELMVAEPLLAFRARESRDVRLLFGRDDGVSLSAAVLSRGAGAWTLQWESPASGCDI
jgi:hypothetical protein